MKLLRDMTKTFVKIYLVLTLLFWAAYGIVQLVEK